MPPGTVTSIFADSLRERRSSVRPARVRRAVKVTVWPASTRALPAAMVLPLALTRATQRPAADDVQRTRMPLRSAVLIFMRFATKMLARTPAGLVTVVAPPDDVLE